MDRISILGAGSWGTALAVLLAKRGNFLTLWGRDIEYINEMKTLKVNRKYLPEVTLPDNIHLTSNLNDTKGSKYLILAVSSKAVRNLLKSLSPLLSGDEIFINCAKGLELGTLKRISQVFEEVLPGAKNSYTILSGPSHAEEVGKGLPTTCVVSGYKKNIAEEVQRLFMGPTFRVYTNPDIIGVELGGSLKNIIALAAGISDGLGFGDNTKAALMTRGIAEITRLGTAMGAKPITFAGLSGVGDLIVTCTSVHSRNRRAGMQIGQGKPLDKVLEEMGMVVEGVRTTKAAYHLSIEYNIEMPITRELYLVLFEGKSPKEGVANLMLRTMTQETEEVAKLNEWDW
jgi:glycerol-3-phosphate dehydrogenase (NAD(P)+)